VALTSQRGSYVCLDHRAAKKSLTGLPEQTAAVKSRARAYLPGSETVPRMPQPAGAGLPFPAGLRMRHAADRAIYTTNITPDPKPWAFGPLHARGFRQALPSASPKDTRGPSNALHLLLHTTRRMSLALYGLSKYAVDSRRQFPTGRAISCSPLSMR